MFRRNPPDGSEVKAARPLTLEDVRKQIKATSDGHQRDVARVLMPYAEILGEASSARVKDYAHRIVLTSPKATVKERRSRYSPEKDLLIQAECERLVREGYIRGRL